MVPCFWSSIVLVNSLHQHHKLFYHNWTPYLHTELWEISSSQTAVAMQIVRHPLLQQPVRKACFSTQCFCHQVCNVHQSNPLLLTDMQTRKPPQSKFCVSVIFSTSFHFLRSCLSSAIPFITFWYPCRSLFLLIIGRITRQFTRLDDIWSVERRTVII